MMDWAKLAEPQLDGSDTAAILEYAANTRYRDIKPASGAVMWTDGRARFQHSLQYLPSNEYTYLPDYDQYVTAGLKQLDLWPAVRRQCAEFLVAVVPLTQVNHPRGGGHGCICGHYADDFGWIYVSAEDVWGFAEGIVHEMAHWKLRALGMWFEEWTDLILLNKPEELYESPVRKDKPRPMGAVLHAQYSYIHVARMTTLQLQALEKPNNQDWEWLELHLKRITEGRDTLRQHARGTPGFGDAFLSGVNEWTDRVIAEGRAAVAAVKC